MKIKNMKWPVILILTIALCTAGFFGWKYAGEQNRVPEMDLNKPVEMYTWEEYRMLSLEEQDRFFASFGSAEAFEAWLKSVRPTEVPVAAIDWDEEKKKPDQYTWEEYLMLQGENQDGFRAWFGSEDAFRRWMESVRPEETVSDPVTIDFSVRKPDAYTWEEYQALSSEEQEAFYQWFDSRNAFEAWMERVKPAETQPSTPVWNKPGKQPDAYTWAEYRQLTQEEREAFEAWFGSDTAFETWAEKNKPVETQPTIPAWNGSGKDPDAYTWDEYQQLTAEEQEAFYQWFGSSGAFEAWMEGVKPADTEPTVPGWNKEGKRPDEYTWAEYQQLTPEEQDAFYNWFDSREDFEAWMDAAMAA